VFTGSGEEEAKFCRPTDKKAKKKVVIQGNSIIKYLIDPQEILNFKIIK
jgi:hypothetical protein